MPQILLSSRWHVRNTGLVLSNVSRTYAEVEYRGAQDDAETCVVEVPQEPRQLLILKRLNANFVLCPVKNARDLSGEPGGRRLEMMELLQGVGWGHGDSPEE
jgi:hypothetical protein